MTSYSRFALVVDIVGPDPYAASIEHIECCAVIPLPDRHYRDFLFRGCRQLQNIDALWRRNGYRAWLYFEDDRVQEKHCEHYVTLARLFPGTGMSDYPIIVTLDGEDWGTSGHSHIHSVVYDKRWMSGALPWVRYGFGNLFSKFNAGRV